MRVAHPTENKADVGSKASQIPRTEGTIKTCRALLRSAPRGRAVGETCAGEGEGGHASPLRQIRSTRRLSRYRGATTIGPAERGGRTEASSSVQEQKGRMMNGHGSAAVSARKNSFRMEKSEKRIVKIDELALRW